MSGGLVQNVALATALLGGMCQFASASESASSSRYDLIPRRNVFKLKEPPQPEPVAPTNPPLAKVNLVGISSMNRKLAFLKLAGASKPGNASVEQSLMLGEGQRDGDIEVLEINERAGLVRIKQGAETLDLSFEKDGLKSNPPANVVNQTMPAENPSTGPGPTPPPQMPNPAASPPPLPVAPQQNYLGKRKLPTRNLNVTPPPLPTIPQPLVPSTPAAQGQPNQLSPDEQEQLLNEVERLKTSPY